MGRPKKTAGKSKYPSKPVFRQRVDQELVNTLLYQFVSLVKQGLRLMLEKPSELVRDAFQKQPELVYQMGDIPILVAWVALGVWELDWPVFCQYVLSHPQWAELLEVRSQADLDRLEQGFDQFAAVRLIELAVHDGFKEGDKQEMRPEGQRPKVQHEFDEFIGASKVLKLLKKRLRPLLKRLDALDPPNPAHRPRTYRSRSFLLADILRWLLRFNSTDELIRRLKQIPSLAGAVNLVPGGIPSKATFSRRRMLLPLDDLKAILHELVELLVRLKVIDGRVWIVDLTRLPTYSSVSKEYPDRPNGKSDPEATFCGYPDNDGGLQFGYSLLFVVDFKTELPFALRFAAGSAHDSPLAQPLLEDACKQHPLLAQNCGYVIGDAGYDAVHIFELILNHLRALPAITKNPRRATDPQADLTTDAFCVLRRRSLWYQALFYSREAVERTNSRIKLTFNLRYQKQRGWEAVERCALFAVIAMLTAAWVAVATGHPEKIRSSWTWVGLN